MDTHFASPERIPPEELLLAIESASENPIIDGLLETVSGLLAVLNEHRQIMAVNPALMEALGIENAREVLGLRPGEALQCSHAHDMPGGCGTSKFCSTCGAAIAIVTSLSHDQTIERTCALEVRRNEKTFDLFLRVRSCPITFDGQRLLLLFLQDITKHQHWASLERVFFHDISNVLTGLVSTTELLVLKSGQEARPLANSAHQLVMRLMQEVKIQQLLTQDGSNKYQPLLQSISVRQIYTDLRHAFHCHPTARGRMLIFSNELLDLALKTDIGLLMRVLSNMMLNALEASDPGDEVRVWAEQSEANIVFCVWNSQVIEPEIAKRIFQRNFSTKSEIGRGLGTYSMKLLGENFMHGTVHFTSTEADGTIFRLSLPML
jgi:signal transduction histidine kinase